MKYKLLAASSPQDLTGIVNTYLQKNWALYGYPFGSDSMVHQAIVDISDEISAMHPSRPMFHPEIDPEVLEEWLAMEGGCAEVESEGVDPDELRAQTKALQSKTDQNAFDLVNTFLDRIATAEVIRVD